MGEQMGRPKTTLSVLYCVYNEEQFIKGSLELVLPFVDEVIVVDNGSTDDTNKIVQSINDPKIKIFDYPKQAVVDMGAVRNYSLEQCTSDWFLQVDADEYYPEQSMKNIRQAVDYNVKSISFRVGYYNLTWRDGYTESGFPHYPDRLYKREAVEGYKGVLPVDMTHVKEEYLLAPNKPKGTVGILEYDNMEDTSQEHPLQPILLDANFYHLARTRGYNFEYTKWKKYVDNLSPEQTEEAREVMVRGNGWVCGMVQMEKVDIPDDIPIDNIVDPKVSIIITNYNYSKYVKDAIDSCLNQTVKPFEIIVVDDKSTDNSVSIIKKLPITLLINDENSGVVHSRNKGIEHSTGDYFICLDADDKLREDFIEKTLAHMKGDVQVVATDMSQFGEMEQEHHIFPEITLENMRSAQCVPSCCALVDRQCFTTSGGYNDSVVYDGYDFWLNLLVKQEYNFVQIHEPLFQYRQHGFSRINILDENQAQGFQELNERYGKFI